MSVGKQEAAKILETINQIEVEAESVPMYPVFSKQNKNFEVLELDDNNRIEEGVISRKPVKLR